MTNSRFCPTGNHFRDRRFFRVRKGGTVVRDCIDCEAARKAGRKCTTTGKIMLADHSDFPGVDIDAIHRNPRWTERTQ